MHTTYWHDYPRLCPQSAATWPELLEPRSHSFLREAGVQGLTPLRQFLCFLGLSPSSMWPLQALAMEEILPPGRDCPDPRPRLQPAGLRSAGRCPRAGLGSGGGEGSLQGQIDSRGWYGCGLSLWPHEGNRVDPCSIHNLGARQILITHITFRP